MFYLPYMARATYDPGHIWPGHYMAWIKVSVVSFIPCGGASGVVMVTGLLVVHPAAVQAIREYS